MPGPSPQKARYTRLSPEQFEALMRAYEISLTGRRAGPGVSTRFLLARDMSCENRNLPDINFTGSNLGGVSFAGSNLTRASFYCCDLRGSDFRRARLERADLRGCKFVGANLSGAVLDEADLRAGVLVQADALRGLRPMTGSGGAGSTGPDGDDARAFAVDFTNCSLRGVRMRNANLKNANFSGANLDGAEFAGARLIGARFDGAILTGVNVERLGLSRTELAGCVVDPSPEALGRLDQIIEQLDNAHAWVTSGGCVGRPAELDGLDLRPANTRLNGRLLVGLSARDTRAIGVDFAHSELPGSNFDGADLRAANFTGCDLRGASFRNANLGHALLLGADISPLPLHDGMVRATVFEGANLAGTALVRPGEAPVVEPRRLETVPF